jgi:Tripartite tricarboxylate transporter TctB family
MWSRVGKDLFLAGIELVLGLFVLWESADFNRLSAVFPQTVGGILAGLGLIHLLQSLFRPVPATKGSTVDGRRALFLTATVVGYVALIGVIGFLPATLLFAGFATWLLQGRRDTPATRISTSVLFSVTVSVGFYFLFRYVFSVPFPAGIWGNG